jgi:hypothetical protein
MKKIFISLALVLTLFRSYADEGMWLPICKGNFKKSMELR